MIRDKILTMIQAQRPGLEIGALDRPIMTRDRGPIEYIDRASREDLLASYGTHANVSAKRIVEVHHIWGDQSLAQCVGKERAYAYLLASHVIEHVPDLYGWLREIAQVLEDGGLAAFVVPDKRKTFDLLRRTSTAGELVDAYVRKLRKPDARQVFDCFHNLRSLNGEGEDGGSTARARQLLAICERIQEDSSDYVDAHCWVFTPLTILDVLDLGSRLGLLPFEIAVLDPTVEGAGEFLLVLRRLPDGLSADAQHAAFAASRAALALPAEADAPAGELAVLAARAELATARADAIANSTIWRATRPLRALMEKLRRT